MKAFFSSKSSILYLGLVGLVIGILGSIVAAQILPDIAASKIRSKIERVEKRLDIKIEFSEFKRKGMLGGQLKDLKVSDKDATDPFFTATLIGTSVSLWKLIQGKIAPTDVWVDGINLTIRENGDGSFDLIERLKKMRSHKKTEQEIPKEDEEPASQNGLDFLPKLIATDISVRFITKENSTWPVNKLRIPEVQIEEKDNYEIKGLVEIEARESDVWQLPSFITLNISVSEDLEPIDGSIKGDTPIRISGLNPYPFLSAGFTSIGFNEDAQIEIHDFNLDLGKPDKNPFFQAKTISITPKSWNPLRGIGIEKIYVSSPTFHDHISKDGRSKLYDIKHMFRPKAPREIIQNAFSITKSIAFKRDRRRVFKGLPPLDNADEVALTPKKTKQIKSNSWSKLKRLLPKQMTIQNASALVIDDRDMSDVEGWAKRLEAKQGKLEFIHNPQTDEIRFDLEFDAFSDNKPKGEVSTLFGWSYSSKKIDADIKIKSLDLLWASQFLGKEVVKYVKGGLVDVDVSVKPTTGSEVQIDGEVSVKNLNIFHPILAEKPIQDFKASYTFSAKYDPKGKIEKAKLMTVPTFSENLSKNSPLRRGSFIVKSGQATINGIPLTFRPKIFGTNALPRLPARFDLFVELKKMPVQKVFKAIPKALLGPLKGSKFGGELSWTLFAETPLQHAADMKWVSKPITSAIRVNYLPYRVDVRRLLNDTKLVIKDTIKRRGKTIPFRRKMYIPTMRNASNAFITENMGIYSDELANHRAAHPIRGSHGKTLSSKAGTDSHGYLRLPSISKYLTRAILTTEDKGFWRHSGISFWALRESLQANLNSGKIRRGGSTIAMQFVKNMFLDRKKLIARKLREAFLVYLMFHVVNVPRERILEIYFNIIEFGPKIFGIHEASVHYFGKRAGELKLNEVAFLVSIIPGPKKWHFHWERGEIPDWWFRRMKRYIEIMYKANRVTEEERNEAIESPPAFWKPEPGGPRYRPKEPAFEGPDSETLNALHDIMNPKKELPAPSPPAE